MPADVGVCIITEQELKQKWQEVRELVPKRDQILQAEMVRQQNNERLREQFAAKANTVGQWLESRLDKVASLGLQKGSLEDHLKTLHSLDDEVAGYRPHIDELERYNQEVRDALVFDNPHTPYTMEVCCLCVISIISVRILPVTWASPVYQSVILHVPVRPSVLLGVHFLTILNTLVSVFGCILFLILLACQAHLRLFAVNFLYFFLIHFLNIFGHFFRSSVCSCLVEQALLVDVSSLWRNQSDNDDLYKYKKVTWMLWLND